MTTEHSQKLRAGQKGYAISPVAGMTGKGRRAYLWIGNDAKGDMRCYATLSGTKTLRKLAHAILRATR